MRDKQTILRAAEKFVLEKKFSAAVAEYQKLLDLEPDEPTLLNIVGDLLVRQGKPQDALKNFQKVVDIFLSRGFTPKAIAMLKKIIWVAPQDLRARESLADLYQKQGLQFDAVREYRNLIDHYVESGDLDRALHFLRRLGTASPDNPDVFLRRAELFEQQGKGDAALKERLEALACQRKNLDFKGFKKNLREVLRADPENRSAFEQLMQIGEACHGEAEVHEILSAQLESGAPEYPVKLFLARAEERLSHPKVAARLYKELRQSGHADHEITEGLLRTDPESAYVSSETAHDIEEEAELVDMPDPDPSGLDWEEDSSVSAQSSSGSGLFADLDSVVDQGPSDGLEHEETFSFDDEDDSLLEDAGEQREELSKAAAEQPAAAPEPPPIHSLDETLQEVDFYLKLGFKDDATSLLERLLVQFPTDEGVLARARKVGLSIPAPVEPAAVEEQAPSEEVSPLQSESVFPDSELFADFEHEVESALDDLFVVDRDHTEAEDEVLRYDISEGAPEESDTPAVHYDLGLAYKEMGLVDDALQEFLIANDMLENDEDLPQQILCCSMLTSTCRQLGKTEDAVRWARKGLKIKGLRDFERRSFEYDLGLALGDLGELKEACKLLGAIHQKDASYRDVTEKLDHLKSRLHG